MSTQPDGSNVLDPFGIWRTTRDANLDAWSKIMIDLVKSDAYSQASATMLDSYLAVSRPFQQALQTAMTQALALTNMPSRDEVLSLAARLTNIEMRLDDLDAKLSTVLDARPAPTRPSGRGPNAKAEA